MHIQSKCIDEGVISKGGKLSKTILSKGGNTGTVIQTIVQDLKVDEVWNACTWEKVQKMVNGLMFHIHYTFTSQLPHIQYKFTVNENRIWCEFVLDFLLIKNASFIVFTFESDSLHICFIFALYSLRMPYIFTSYSLHIHFIFTSYVLSIRTTYDVNWFDIGSKQSPFLTLVLSFSLTTLMLRRNMFLLFLGRCLAIVGTIVCQYGILRHHHFLVAPVTYHEMLPR